MAKEWAKSFYDSAKWKKARQLCISRKHGICERCGKAFASSKMIVHHKIHLTADNINNPDVSLSQDNLQLLCHDCHNSEHGNKNDSRIIQFDSDGNIINVLDKER